MNPIHRLLPICIRRPKPFALFLDFDGVLHPSQSATFRYLPAFEATLRGYPDIDIVISSNWREGEPFDELLDYFSAGFRDRLIGATAVLPGPYSRQREIEAYCRSFGIERWLAIDDDGTLFVPGCPQLILLSRNEALDEVGRRRLADRLAAWTHSPWTGS
jgi:hypothetical protein